jgi:hypothetical protein
VACDMSFQLLGHVGPMRPSVIEDTVGGLMVASQRRGQLRGGDLDMITDTLDVVLKQMNGEIQNGANMVALNGTVRKIFTVRLKYSCIARR